MIVLSALVGGRGTLYGPVVGAFIVQLGSARRPPSTAAAAAGCSSSGLAAVLIVLFIPAGLLPTGAAWLAAPAPGGGRVHRPGRRARRRAPAGARPRAAAPAWPTGRDAATPRRRAAARGARARRKAFGGLVAVDDADLTVRQGSDHRADRAERLGQDDAVQPGHRRHAGRRGRGLVRRARGSTGCTPWTRGHLGLARTFQTTRLFKR